MSIPPTETETVVKVSWWVHLVPVLVAIIGLVQAFGFVWLQNSSQETTAAVKDTTVAVNKLETQINSNMQKEIDRAIRTAIAEYQMKVLGEKVEANRVEEAKEDKAEEKKSP